MLSLLQRIVIVMLLCVCCVAVGAAQYSSPIDLVGHTPSQRLYVAEATGQRIVTVDTAQHKVLGEISVTETLSGLALSQDGQTMYATGGGAEGRVFVVQPKQSKVKATWTVGHTPVGPVLDGAQKRLYVCNRFNDNVVVLSTETGKVLATIPVLREPSAAALSHDGNYLFVTNLLHVGPANGNYAAAQVSVIDTRDLKVAKTIKLPNGSNQLLDIVMSPDGHYAYVTHLLARYQVPTTQLERGWINTNALTVIDTRNRTRVNTVLLDDVGQGAANPWGVTCTADGKYLVVNLSGCDEICIVDRPGLHKLLDKALEEGQSDNVPNNLAFLHAIKKRISMPGLGLRPVTVMGSRIYIGAYFSDQVLSMDVQGLRPGAVKELALRSPVAMTEERRGEMFFNSAKLCFQNWQSCASCHTSDARVDALNWDLMNDDLGNPKNTRSLLLSHQTPPVMSRGVRADAETAVRAGIRHIQFAVRPDEDAQAIDTYLKSLKPIPSPHLVKGELSPAALRGKDIFKEASCAYCHPAPLFTNNKLYDVGLGEGREVGIKFDTPTLVELWRTAPYLHDGRATTIKEVLTTHNPDDKHGKTSTLTKQEIKDLEAYLLSL